MRKIVIATGGTGGHLFPAMQLKELLSQEVVLFAGHKLKNSPFFDQSLPFVEIVSTLSKWKWPLLVKGLWQACKLLRKFKPDVVVGFGSFHSFPLLAAATLLRIPIVLFEANCTLGKVNRWFLPFAKKLAVQFPISHPKHVLVHKLPWIIKPKARSKYVKEENRVAILVFGGSQGATFINELFFLAAPKLSFPIQVIHLTGNQSCPLQYECPAVVKPFETDMESAYLTADFVVSRAGAGTCAELIRYEKPAVLIPYPYAYDHQKKNGEYLQKGVRLLLQQEASVERLVEEMEQLYKNLKEHKAALKNLHAHKTIGLDEVIRSLGEKS